MSALGVGTLKSDKCDLKKVYYIPNLSNLFRNLLSVNAITKNNVILFTKENIKVEDNVVCLKVRKITMGRIINLHAENETLVAQHDGVSME